MAKFKKIMKAFCRQSLGGLAGEILLEDYTKRYNILDLDQLDKTQQLKFVDAFLHGIFHNHLPQQRIDSIKLQLNLHFSLEEAAEKISKMLGKKIDMEPMDIKYQTNENIKKILENLEDGIITIPISFSGCMEGSVLVSIFRDSAIQLGNLMLQSMMGIAKSDDYLDDMKQSAIKEFFNIVLPTFTNKIANILGQTLLLELPETDILDSKTQIDNVTELLEKNELKKILSTPIELQIEGGKTVGGMAFVLISSELELISDSLEDADIEADDSIEKMDLSSIEVNIEVGRYRGVVEFLSNFLKVDPNKVVDDTMVSFGITSLSNVSVGIRRQFVDDIIANHFSSNSPKIQKFIKSGIQQIFNIDEKHVEYKTDSRATSDTLNKMVRH